LAERIERVMWVHREFQPTRVAYEEYGMQADIEAIKMEQERQKYRFDIQPLGGKLAKFDRIQGLAPTFEQGRIYAPASLFVPLKETGELHDMIDIFVRHEFTAWPYAAHDDMLDVLARINDPDLGVIWPRAADSASRMQRRMTQRVPRKAYGWVT
jgi:hypothetical protein